MRIAITLALDASEVEAKTDGGTVCAERLFSVGTTTSFRHSAIGEFTIETPKSDLFFHSEVLAYPPDSLGTQPAAPAFVERLVTGARNLAIG